MHELFSNIDVCLKICSYAPPLTVATLLVMHELLGTSMAEAAGVINHLYTEITVWKLMPDFGNWSTDYKQRQMKQLRRKLCLY